MKTRSNRLKRSTESHSVYLVAVAVIFAGAASIWLSWKIEEAQEDLSRARSSLTRNASFNEASHTNSDAGANPVNAVTEQTIFSDSTASVALILGLTNPRWKIVSKGLGELGLALISVGLIAVLLEIRVMSNYFQGKIAKSMIGREYLTKLTKGQLRELQADAVKAYWDVEEKDDRKDLLEYCRDQVESFIAEPFRESVHGTFTVKRKDEKYYEVEETISYTCRAIQRKIQREVKWTTGSGEIGDIQKFRIELTMPTEEWNEREGKWKKPVEWFEMKPKNPNSGANSLHVGSEVISGEDGFSSGSPEDYLRRKHREWWRPKLRHLTGGCIGYRLDLAHYQSLDKLHVTVQTKYEAPLGRSITWQMTHPSRKVTGVVNFEELSFYLESFGVCDQNLHPESKSAQASPHTFVYDSWLLPESGFVFHFLPPLVDH